MGDLFPLNSCFAFNIQIRNFLELEKLLMARKYIIKLMIVIILILFVQAYLLSIIFHFTFTVLILPKLIITHLYTISLRRYVLPNCKTKFEPGSTHFQTIGRCLLPYGGLLTWMLWRTHQEALRCHLSISIYIYITYSTISSWTCIFAHPLINKISLCDTRL